MGANITQKKKKARQRRHLKRVKLRAKENRQQRQKKK